MVEKVFTTDGRFGSVYAWGDPVFQIDRAATSERALAYFSTSTNIDIDCSELMGSKASDVAVVGSRCPVADAIVRQLVMLSGGRNCPAISHADLSTSTMTSQLCNCIDTARERVARKTHPTRASRSAVNFDTDLFTPRHSLCLEIRKQIRLATSNKT